jgi:carbon-monoxide dehydrogenase large subunit
MTALKFGIGQPVRRREDDRFLRGAGAYTADLVPPDAVHAVVLRSPHAHARFSLPDVRAAERMPGVHMVLTAADVSHLGHLPCGAPLAWSDDRTMHLPPFPLLAHQRVRHVGDAVAVVIAETEWQARDALEAIVIDYESLPAVSDTAGALDADAPRVWDEVDGNLAVEREMGDADAVRAIFDTAAHVARVRVVNTRLVSNYMEPRAAIGSYDGGTGRFTLTTGSQGVHGLRDTLANAVFGVRPELMRVVTPDVGGGFGPKALLYREHALVLEAAKITGRPVVWICDRSEHFLADAHGRDNVSVAEMALDADGRFLALRVDIIGNLGAYLSQYGPYIPWLGVTMATGPYRIPAFHGRLRDVYTHTPPTDAYRGAGRPEAAYLLERLVDECARVMDMPREDIRARNFISRAEMPFATPTGRTYDVGDFEGAMRSALELADAPGFEARLEEAKSRGRLRGLGMASYIECTAWGEGEETVITLDDDGGVTVPVGTQSSGQGHETAFTQIVAEILGLDAQQVRVVQGDTSLVRSGGGTGGSRSIPIGAVALRAAARDLAQKLRDLASEDLEADAGDLELIDGAVRVAGTDRAIAFTELASRATSRRLTGEGAYTPDSATYPNGTHVCEVEIDPETGAVTLVAYHICDDFGAVLNPMLLQGQVHGGIAQGAGQALMEQVMFLSDGQMPTASFNDYCMPRAADFPNIGFSTRNVPSTTNPLGLKGAGEAGTIGATPAVANAVIDALWRGRGIRQFDMPATPSRVLAALSGKHS